MVTRSLDDVIVRNPMTMIMGGGCLDDVTMNYVHSIQMHGANVLLSDHGSNQEQSDIYLYQVKYSKQVLFKIRFVYFD